MCTRHAVFCLFVQRALLQMMDQSDRKCDIMPWLDINLHFVKVLNSALVCKSDLQFSHPDYDASEAARQTRNIYLKKKKSSQRKNDQESQKRTSILHLVVTYKIVFRKLGKEADSAKTHRGKQGSKEDRSSRKEEHCSIGRQLYPTLSDKDEDEEEESFEDAVQDFRTQLDGFSK